MAKESLDWGARWSDDIDRELAACECYFLLLSDEAAKSDFVSGELESVCERRERSGGGQPRILVLAVQLQQTPPLNVWARVRRFQLREWNSETDTELRIAEILSLLASPEGLLPNPPQIGNLQTAAPAAELPGGQISIRSDLYQTRKGIDLYHQ
jgi:hypothetical protein